MLLLGILPIINGQSAGLFSANKRILDLIQKPMIETMDPCKDFKYYAKGEKTKLTSRFEAHEMMNPKFMALFEQLKYRTLEPGSLEEKVLRLYNACQVAMEREEVINYWEAVQQNVSLSVEGFHWLVTLGQLRRYGMGLVLQMSPEFDHQSGKYMLMLGAYRFITRERYAVWGDVDWLTRQLGVNRTQAKSLYKDMTLLQDGLLGLNSMERYNRRRMTLDELKTKHGIPMEKYLEIVLGRPLTPDYEVLVDNLNFLVALNRVMTSQSPVAVATYLMGLFVRFMEVLSLEINNPRDYEFVCVNMVRNAMRSASYLLYEEHVLGAAKVQEFETEVQRVFKAIKAQFDQRLEANRLNLSIPHILSLQEILNSITVNVGSMPIKDGGRRQYLTRLYADFQNDDDLATIRLKALEKQSRLGLEKEHNLKFVDSYTDIAGRDPPEAVPIHPILTGNATAIIVPLSILAEPFFTIRGHDIFKMSLLGYLLANEVLTALFPYPKLPHSGCQKYNELLGLLDNRQLYRDRSPCISPNECEMSNWREISLVLLNIVYDAYFSAGSTFNQTQLEDLTNKSLKQLFFIDFVQNTDWTYFMDSYDTDKRSDILEPFAEAFNCPKIL
ncbi:uncharacterized protein [Drosophila kikkawai]|uniref:Peptidase M13 N-terminal domain-containing protein n=1 Tax=Drosophila kikkawai TaxID=30033 RepID=A0A6P4I1R8_DROKI